MSVTTSSISDQELLRQFVTDRDEVAFATLVERHRSFIVNVCKRLAPAGEADDAAQLTFITLAKQSDLLLDQLEFRASLTGWLYRVAVNAALQQRRAHVARHQRERVAAGLGVAANDRPDAADRLARQEQLAIVEEELNRLPEECRLAIILFHLQGKTHHAAARELALSLGTLRRRLQEGRVLLRSRMLQRGVVPTVALFAAFRHACNAATFKLTAASAAQAGRRIQCRPGACPIVESGSAAKLASTRFHRIQRCAGCSPSAKARPRSNRAANHIAVSTPDSANAHYVGWNCASAVGNVSPCGDNSRRERADRRHRAISSRLQLWYRSLEPGPPAICLMLRLAASRR